MSRALRILALLAFVVCWDWYPSVPPYPVEAQGLSPKAWPADQNGVPAPACTTFDPTTGALTFCSSANPLPTSSAGTTGQGSTSGTTVTGFGKGWFPSNFLPAGNMPVLFDTASTVVGFTRLVGGGNNLLINTSTDGGVTYQTFQTSFVAGNTVLSMIKVPSATPRYLGYVANGASSHVFSSTALLSGWADSVYGGTQIQNGALFFASNLTGSTVLSIAGTGASVEVCRSTNQGVTFGSCSTFSTSNQSGTQSITFAGGTTWLAVDNGGRIWQSTNDGVSFTQISSVNGGGGSGSAILCLSSTYASCLASFNGQLSQSQNGGTTWTPLISVGGAPQFCDYGGGTANAFTLSTTLLPTGFAAVTQNAWTTFNSGVTLYPGSTFGSPWNGVGVVNLSNVACSSTGRSAAATTTGGTPATIAFYNPLTQPGGVNQSSAGGYTVSALIQAGVLLNATQTSAATTAQTITLTGTSGSRVCIRRITLFSSTASQNVTLVVQDATATTLNFGTVSTTATAGNPLDFAGQPLFCGQTGDSLQVVVGAAAAGTTTLSVVADRYPN